MKHYTITIKVAYDETTVASDMAQRLRHNVERCVTRESLLTDYDLEAVVEEWKVIVEEVP